MYNFLSKRVVGKVWILKYRVVRGQRQLAVTDHDKSYWSMIDRPAVWWVMPHTTVGRDFGRLAVLFMVGIPKNG